jgi:N-acyl amino acid synthase of PEP-CTERM/exosortase system
MLFPFQQHCTRLFPGNPLPSMNECAEISRVVVSKALKRCVSGAALEPAPRPSGIVLDPSRVAARQTQENTRGTATSILLGMIRQTYRYSKNAGIKYWYVAVESALARMLRRMNFLIEAIGEEQDYYGPVTPCILAIAKFEADLRRNDPAMFDWFASALTEKVEMPLNTLSGHTHQVARRGRIGHRAPAPLHALSEHGRTDQQASPAH